MFPYPYHARLRVEKSFTFIIEIDQIELPAFWQFLHLSLVNHGWEGMPCRNTLFQHPWLLAWGTVGFFHIKNYWTFEVGEPCGGVFPFVDLLHINNSNCTVWPTGSWAQLNDSSYHDTSRFHIWNHSAKKNCFSLHNHILVSVKTRWWSKLTRCWPSWMLVRDKGTLTHQFPFGSRQLTASMWAWHWHWRQLSVLDQDIPW